MIIENGCWTVYVHVNKINGKMYVGVTSKSMEERAGYQGHRYNPKLYFGKAIRKYGWDNFDHEIIASHLTEEEASNMEKLLINKLQLNDPRYGYNIAEGGNLCCVLHGEKHPYYGKHREAEVVDKIRQSHYGKSPDKEVRQKISDKLKGKYYGSKRVQVRCIETGIVYESYNAASRAAGVSASSIRYCITGRQKVSAGFHWEAA